MSGVFELGIVLEEINPAEIVIYKMKRIGDRDMSLSFIYHVNKYLKRLTCSSTVTISELAKYSMFIKFYIKLKKMPT